jgi:ribosomal protein S18 acetylase RimI-like enzyme
MPQLSPSGVAVRVRDAHRSDRRAVRALLLAAYREYAAVLPPAVFGPYLADILDLDARDGESGGLEERGAGGSGGVRGAPGGFPGGSGPPDVPGRLLVAEHDRRVVGAVTFYEDAAAEGLGWPAGWAGLRALGVDPAARRLGAGRALMDACLERALAARAPVLCLHTAAFMTAAVAMYEAMGFGRAPSFDFEVPAGGGAPPVGIIAYRLDLPHGNGHA